MDTTADRNTLIDVLSQHFNKNFGLRYVSLEEITSNTSFHLASVPK
jgi:hypothetical protein